MAYSVTVRYGSMGLLGKFKSETALRRGDKVVLRTERGSEDGEIVHPAEALADAPAPADGEVVRALSADDEKELRRIRDEAIPKELAFCRDRIKALELPMKLVDAEHLLGGEKIIFYFLADGRVDFRQLVKDIAREYKTRIELRQIGVRDEARLLAELGHCGQCLCCRSFMKSLEPVTMRMAKSQKATLDPTKISGVCGRLMCCLRYEDKVYGELKTKLPKRGVNVNTRKAAGKVIDTDVLAQTVSIRTVNSNIVRVHVSDIISIEGVGTPQEEASNDAEAAAAEAPNCSATAPCGECPRENDRPSGSIKEAPKPQEQPERPGQRQEQGPGQDQRGDRRERPNQGQGREAGQGGQQHGGQGQGQGQGRRHGRRGRRNRSQRRGNGGGGGGGKQP